MLRRKAIKEAIKILMLSPVYFRLNTKDRMVLVNEFCFVHGGNSSMERFMRSKP